MNTLPAFDSRGESVILRPVVYSDAMFRRWRVTPRADDTI